MEIALPSKLALLIDAENISYKDLPRILEEVPRHGQLILQAVYGDWQSPSLQKWHEIATKNKFEIRNQTNLSKTKNSSDMKLIMDAMEALYRTPVDIFCLVSNDADYVALCDKIHEAKKYVIGVGNQHASEAFIRACDIFIFIGRGETPAQPSIQSLIASSAEVPSSSPKQPSTPTPIKPPDVRKILTQTFAQAPKDANGWVGMPALGTGLRQVQADFQISTYGHATLTKLLQSLPDFVELRLDGNSMLARLKNNTPAKQPQLNHVQKLLTEAFTQAPQDANRWVTLNKLGNALSQVQKGFKTKNYGHSNINQLLQSMPDFVELRVKGSDTSARLKK
jgi:hypothetical protein